MSTDLPPEAYTRETLQEAFNWLQSQPETIRDHVHTPERLVSLYQKSQRLNDKDAPVSSKKFITDLKNLATSLDQFNSDGETETTQQTQITTNSILAHQQQTITSTPVTAPKTKNLDPLTQERLDKVRSRFNLGSEGEALRLLVSLGYEKFSQMD